MLSESEFYCPDCDNGLDVRAPRSRRQTRREFLGTAVAGAASTGLLLTPASAERRAARPAEALIRELHASLSDDQKKKLVLPRDHKRRDGKLSRLGTYNSAILGKRLDTHLTNAQQELVQRTVFSLLSGDDAWERITRYGRWDNSGSFERTGCALFGEPGDDQKYSWVFSGHHLTLRCDGNTEPDTAFGGPIYYGHSVNGYNKRNVYLYQTQQVQAVWDALNPAQRKIATAARNPGDRERGFQFPKPGTARPGIAFQALQDDQQKLVASVMRTLLSPFRQEDAREVMQIVEANGGMKQIHLAFYKDRRSTDDQVRWNYWRLEGPGFIWNYRVLPHVHCYVNIVNS